MLASEEEPMMRLLMLGAGKILDMSSDIKLTCDAPAAVDDGAMLLVSVSCWNLPDSKRGVFEKG
jgi:hypothetical protein